MAMYVNSTGGPPNVAREIARSSANYHPSIWGEKFLPYCNSPLVKTDADQKEEEHLQLLRQQVKKMLVAGDTTQHELISLIDDIQRLGLSYHYEAELDTLLEHIKESFHELYCGENDVGLHDVALCFRLLRQQGHDVSSDVFYKFKDSKGKFREHLAKDVLLDLAIRDFNQVQKLHQIELGHITRCWKDLDFSNKLSFARDRVGAQIALTYRLTIFYTNYRSAARVHQTYRPLLEAFSKSEEEIEKEGRPSYGFLYAKDAFKRLTRGYFAEAKWCQVQYFPRFEEYMSVALISEAYKMLSVTSFVLMGNVATRDAFDWISKDPLIVKASSVICRLSDNHIVGHEFELERPHTPTAVECFMKQYGVPIAAPMPLLKRVFNLACVINLLYDGDDGYTHSSTRTKYMITSVLVDPVPV
ncbi:hypothetical protein POM88_000639 [Heracleum sosnowskyi]|uniref:Sesquiterpene synthase n=1 Tax=Heracleum sosnowskyi TaxID=360622 RepID=A0AAD8JBI5_9APIA|nr:hypothetical protein POM88_000639 [Heracleum sosnowskyi]